MSDAATLKRKDRFLAELDIYKFQVDLGVKIAPAILTIAGSILAFILTRDGLPRWTSVLSLTIPLLLCIGFLVMYFIAADGAKDLQELHERTATKLRLEPFNFGLLVGVCRLGYWLCLLAAAGIIIIMIAIATDKVQTAEKPKAVSLSCQPSK